MSKDQSGAAAGGPAASLEAAVGDLTPEEAEFFLAKLERVMRKRKLQMTGYLVGMFAWVIGMIGSLVYIGTHDGFTSWVFLFPFGLLGACIYGFGKWATRVGADPR